MWHSVRMQLENMLSTKFFPRLVGDPFYNDMLRRAGIPLTVTHFEKLTQAQRTNLRGAVVLEMGLFTRGVESKLAVEASTLQVGIQKNVWLYRAANSAYPASRDGIWWFDEALWKKCLQVGPNDTDRLRWLHQALAVCYDWSQCDRIVRIRTGDPGIPAVRAIGSAKTRLDSPRMLSQPLPGIHVQATIFGGLDGGLTQTILPFIPRDYMEQVQRFSTAELGKPLAYKH